MALNLKPQPHTPTLTPLETQIDTLNRYLPWDAPEKTSIVRAVNCHQELVEDLAVCLQSFGKDMQNDFRRRIERHLQDAIAKGEGLCKP